MGSYVKKASTDMAIGAVKGDKDKGNKRHSGILKATDKITKEEVEVLDERQKDSDNQRLSQERGRSNYGKAQSRSRFSGSKKHGSLTMNLQGRR